MLILPICALFCPIIAFQLLGVAFQKYKNAPLFATLFGLIMAAMFYGYDGDIGFDIYRHIEWLEKYKNVPIWKCFNVGHYNNLYIWDLWCWCIAQLGNPRLLQSSAAFIIYAITGYIVIDTAGRNNNSSSIMVYLFFIVCVLRMRDVVSGIRSASGCVLCAFAAYRYYVKEKSIVSCAIIALVGSFIHISSVQFVILFIAMPILVKNIKLYTIIAFCITGFIATVGPIVINQIPGFGLLEDVKQQVLRLLVYVNTQKDQSINTFVNQWWLVGVCCATIWRIATYNRLDNQSTKPKEYKLYQFGVICFALNLGYCFSLNLNADRMLIVNEVAMLPYFVYSCSKYGFMENRRLVIQDLVFLVFVIGSLLLHVYSMLWGTASKSSLLIGALLGILSIWF